MIHKAKIYPGVYLRRRHNGQVEYTSKFTKWADETLTGGYEVGTIDDRAFCLLFDLEDDLVAYQLCWDQPENPTNFDVGTFYCPYVPLTVVNATTSSETLANTPITFTTRYTQE